MVNSGCCLPSIVRCFSSLGRLNDCECTNTLAQKSLPRRGKQGQTQRDAAAQRSSRAVAADVPLLKEVSDIGPFVQPEGPESEPASAYRDPGSPLGPCVRTDLTQSCARTCCHCTQPCAVCHVVDRYPPPSHNHHLGCLGGKIATRPTRERADRRTGTSRPSSARAGCHVSKSPVA